ncbi:MAG: periplasmic heavy metal sensor [Pseudomonadota bacterium]
MSETPNRILPVILIVSLVLNGLLVGLLIGGGLRQDQPPPAPDRGERALVRGLERSVAEEDRSAVRGALREAFQQTRGERQKLREARRELRIALAADPYDAIDVTKAFEAVRLAEAAAQTELHNELAQQFERLSAEERATILRGLDRTGRRSPRRQEGRRFERPQRPDDN